MVYLQCDDVNNMTVKPGNWTHTEPAVAALLRVAAAQQPAPLPFLFVSDAASSSSKPYREFFECVATALTIATARAQSPRLLQRRRCRRPSALYICVAAVHASLCLVRRVSSASEGVRSCAARPFLECACAAVTGTWGKLSLCSRASLRCAMPRPAHTPSAARTLMRAFSPLSRLIPTPPPKV